MAVFFVTGKLGAGKTLASVWRLALYIQRGSPVATNLDLFFEHWPRPRLRELNCTRLPDKPTARDLQALGRGNETYDEDKNGLVVLDECGTWFNSRTWNDKDRQDLIKWFLHARKLGWDVIFIVQDLDIVDKQARDALCEHAVFCKRMDRMSIPIIGPLLRMFGFEKIMPRIHIGVVVYGDTRQHPIVNRWWYRGDSWQKLYDTKQVFQPEMRDYVHAGAASPAQASPGIFSYLSPWHLKGHALRPRLKPREAVAVVATLALRATAYATVLAAAAVTGRSPATVAAQWGLVKRKPARLTWRNGPTCHATPDAAASTFLPNQCEPPRSAHVSRS